MNIVRKASGVFSGAQVRQEVPWAEGTMVAGGSQSAGQGPSPGGLGWPTRGPVQMLPPAAQTYMWTEGFSWQAGLPPSPIY